MYEIIEIENEKILKKINNDNSISWIPIDSGNSDYQAYLRWLENPNEAEQFTPNLTE
jgi:hypothetical protein